MRNSKLRINTVLLLSKISLVIKDSSSDLLTSLYKMADDICTLICRQPTVFCLPHTSRGHTNVLAFPGKHCRHLLAAVFIDFIVLNVILHP